MSTETIVRFNVKQRAEHFLTMVVFTLLCLTGLPQKFFQAGWAHGLVDLFGGISNARLIHRICGIGLALSTVVHFGNAIASILSKKATMSMVPVKRDFEDAVLQTIRVNGMRACYIRPIIYRGYAALGAALAH